MRRKEIACKHKNDVMRNRDKTNIKYLIFKNLVMVFGLEKAERLFRMFEWWKS